MILVLIIIRMIVQINITMLFSQSCCVYEMIITSLKSKGEHGRN